ncbi:tetratricopeptide repeat protein [Archangium minus]|uniref:Tetratricopeptide repeat protein n=2 Tax=Archangium minus TaxID=83450 RepID=A0ABY9WLF4_9BACT|nr:tetratricopeptide repeat protein [Archangium minus]
MRAMRFLTPCVLLLAVACAHTPAPSSTSTSTPATTAPAATTLPSMEPPATPKPGWLMVYRADTLMRQGKHAEALPLYQQAWAAGNRKGDTAYSAACAAALEGRKDEAMTWLERSVENGFRDAEWMKQDEDLSSLRELPAFTALLAKLPTLPPHAEEGGGGNPELQRLMAEDQADRRPPAGPITPDHWKQIAERDQQRRQRVSELLDAGAAKTGADFFAAALVFQHGNALEDYARARELAAEAARRGHPRGLWLTAAAWDRWLMKAGQPQRFGTQYQLDKATGKMSLYPVDPAVTDAERERWGVPPLAEIRPQM